MTILIRKNVLACILALAILNPRLATLFAQTTAFTYQGRLEDGGVRSMAATT